MYRTKEIKYENKNFKLKKQKFHKPRIKCIKKYVKNITNFKY